MNSLEFQLYDWLEDHQILNNDNDDDDYEEVLGEFIIHSFGRCMDGSSVYAKIINFTPYFYIILPDELQNKSEKKIKNVINKMYDFLTGQENNKIQYKYKITLTEINLVKLKKAEGFTNNTEFYFARLIFNNADGMKKYKNYFEYNYVKIPGIEYQNKSYKYKLYEANLPPMLRCFHIRDISGCSWISTNDYELVGDSLLKESLCDIEIIVDWRKINPIKKDTNAPLRIASFDIEVYSIDGEFPQAKRKGDSVIQIGVTYTYLGKSIPYRQYVACLDNTSNLDGIIVESYETEEELIMAFLNEINNNDCDIMTGYNTFFFDEKYIYDRCKIILKMEKSISYLSKLKNYSCPFIERKLASSSLGENYLRYWNTPGRVHIDLMKDIQKTYTLPSYKLDYVASKYIRGEVLSYNVLENDEFELLCKSIQDICKGDYIHLEVIKGFISDEVGDKYNVLNIDEETKTIIIKGDNFLKMELDTVRLGGIINWSQAKDDVGPKDIFRLQKGSNIDRSIVAKYCVKDCKLVNLLINKLEIVTKGIEMANVSFIPLSYLFIRGQGIKLFSLCLKEFRKHKYAFPVLKMDKLYKCQNSRCRYEFKNLWKCPKCKSENKDEIEMESSKYEGAIVFDPVPSVEYEACATKDYASLYPSSIMHKNISHETIVENSEYDNLENITYYNAQYRESDGSIVHRRFAKVNDTLGVIPTILNNLLKERKSIKKLMKTELDPFKLKILDAKQLAVKLTANSLYGQLGAPTSAIFKRDLAACTTSTGREMLILAKKYDEEILPGLINGLKYYYANNDIDNINKLYDLELKARNDNKFINNLEKYVTQDIHNLTFQPIIRYGDSVIGSTPLLLRNSETGQIYTELINNMSNTYNLMFRENNDQNKESSELNNIESWTEQGWTKVYRVIRHKLAQDKKLFKITTNSGFVIVTDDHSLLTDEGNIISSKTLKIGDKLLHSSPDNCYNDDNYNVVIDIIEWIEKEEYVYDLTTENNHFQAGVGNIIVHNTDSIFSCYRFRENTIKVDDNKALKIWTNIVSFAKKLIEPYFNSNNFNELFDKYYSNITELKLPMLHLENNTNNLLLFLKEYMEESYLPWLWTLAELVEKDRTFMFNIKLTQWAEHLLIKYNFKAENLDENRNIYILKPLLLFINKLFIDKYETPTDTNINDFTKIILSLPYSNEIKKDEIQINKLVKIFFEKTIKEKWIYSGEKKELLKIIKTYLSNIFNNDIIYNDIIYNDMIINYIIDFIGNNRNVEHDTLCILLIKDLKKKLKLNEELDINEITKDFIETYYKDIGKKTMKELLIDFMQKELSINFTLWKENHYHFVINFINNNMRYEDMSGLFDQKKYIYYWLQPRWAINNKIKEFWIDIYEGGESINDKRTLNFGMELGKLSGELVKSRLPFPHDLEYEKTFWPFAILTKKRYVGNKYEDNPNIYKLDYMGIVLKRRDNAIIVKEICGGIIDYLINKRDPAGAIKYTKECIQKMFEGKYDIKYFLQSRNLKSKESYKDWSKIAHVYLANELAKRDPGNVPQSGDRIEYAVIKVDNKENKKLLQGERIDTPLYIKQNKLEIDYLFYLTNQIMNPALQFLELVDKNAKYIFDEFIETYSIPKNKKISIPKIKVLKEKVIKPKKNKIIKTEKNAYDILVDKKNKLYDNKYHNLIKKINKYIEQIKKIKSNL